MPRICRPLALVVAALALLVAPGVAAGAVVTNGDFETGNLSGWTSTNESSSSTMNKWYAYTGTEAPVSGNPVHAPPQGKYAALTDQNGGGLHILSQDLTLPPGGTLYQLSMIAYYNSQAPIASPASLSADVDPNQQYRIDVMKPGTAIDSVAPADILATVLRTKTGDPDVLAPTQETADLAAYAGQTVRLRFAEVDNQLFFNASVDAVAVNTNGFTVGAAVKNKKKGTAQVPVTVPGDGTLALTGAGVVQTSSAPASKSVAVGTGTATLVVKASGKKKRKLKKKGKAKVNVAITYTPTGLSPATQNLKVTLKKKTKKKKA
jgi:hypothetical protein